MKTRRITAALTLLIAFSVSATAQIGIGTTTPNSTLDVRGSLSTGYRVFTTSTAATTDNTLVFTGTSAATVTLPDATVCAGRIYYIKNASTTLPTPVLTMATTSSQTIDALSTWTLDEPNEVVRVVSNGVNWYVALQDVPVGKTATTGGSWNQGGNRVTAAKAFGTITNLDLPFITNNTEKMRLSATGNLGIGTTSFDVSNPEKLLVNAGTTTSYNVISGRGSINSYLQMNITNTSGAASASTDLVATNDAGPYVDLGINSSGYNNVLNPILNGFNNAYLYTTGGDFIIGDSTPAKSLILFTGGTANVNERMRITGTGNVGIGTTTPAAVLDVSGTYKLGASGTVLTNMIKTNVAINDANLFNYNSTEQVTITVTGAAVNATVIVNPRTALPQGIGIGWARVSASNTIIIGFTNSDTTSKSIGSVTLDVMVIE